MEELREPRARLFIGRIERVRALEMHECRVDIAGTEREVGFGHQAPARDLGRRRTRGIE